MLRSFAQILLLSAILADSAMARVVNHAAVTPVPRPDVADWMERFEQHNNALDELVPLGRPEIVFLGDSITESWQWEGDRVWKSNFASSRSLALGLGGDRTEHLLWRLQNGTLDRLEKNPPRIVVLLIGTNNVWVNTEREMADGILLIVDTLRKKLPTTQLVVTAIFPYGAEPNEWRDRNNATNKILAVQLKRRTGVRWLDLSTQFLDEKGAMYSELTTDELHLTHDGYALWAEGVRSVLPATGIQ